MISQKFFQRSKLLSGKFNTQDNLWHKNSTKKHVIIPSITPLITMNVRKYFLEGRTEFYDSTMTHFLSFIISFHALKKNAVVY